MSNYKKKTGRPKRKCKTVFLGYRVDEYVGKEFMKLKKKRRFLEVALCNALGLNIDNLRE